MSNKLEKINQQLIILEQVTENKIIELHSIIKGKEDNITELHNTINQKDEKIKNLEKRNNTLEKKIKSAKIEKRELEAFLKNIQEKNLKSKNKQLTSSKFIEEIEDVKWEYEKEIENLKKNSKIELENLKKNYKKIIDQLRNEIKKKELENDQQLSQEKTRYMKRLENIDIEKRETYFEEIEKLKGKLRDYKEENINLEDKYNKIKSELFDLKNSPNFERKKFEDEKKNLISEINSLRKQNYELKKYSEEMQESFESKINYIEDQNSGSNTEIIYLKEQIEKQIDNINKLKIQSSKTKKENIIDIYNNDNKKSNLRLEEIRGNLIYFKIENNLLIRINIRPEEGIYVIFQEEPKKWLLIIDINSSQIEIRKAERLLRSTSKYGLIMKDSKRIGVNSILEIIRK